MPPQVIPAHYDGQSIRLDRPVELKENARLLVTVLPEEDTEREEWARFAMQNLERAYSVNEPDYSNAKLIWVNPEYEGR